MPDTPRSAFVQPAVGGEYTNISSDTLIKSGEGHLVGIFVASASGASIKVWDNTAGSTTVLVNTFSVVAGQWYPLPFRFKTGLYVDITGTIDCTVSWH